jgi:hypothetical protein
MPPLSVKVEVSPKLLGLANELQKRTPRLYAEAAKGMRDEVARKAPGGPAGKIGRSFRAVGPLVVSSSPAAHALEGGAYIKAKNNRRTTGGRRGVIRFQGDDGPVYRMGVKIPAKHYVRKALVRRKSIIDKAVRKVYGDLLG